MDFRSGGTKRSANISPFLLRSLKAERCDFLGENCSIARSFKKLILPIWWWWQKRRKEMEMWWWWWRRKNIKIVVEEPGKQ